MDLPSIPLLPPLSRDIMLCIPPNLFSTPHSIRRFRVRLGIRPYRALGFKGRGFNVLGPSFCKEGDGYF